MDQDHLYEECLNTAKLMFDQGLSIHAIEAKLLKTTISPEQREEIMKQIHQWRHIRRNKNGGLLVISGVLLLGSGFICSIYLHFNGSNSLDFPLYGLTAAGAVILIIGLIFIFH